MAYFFERLGRYMRYHKKLFQISMFASLFLSACSDKVKEPVSNNNKAIEPVIEIQPDILDFGEIEINSSVTKNITVHNPQEKPIEIDSILLNGDTDAFQYIELLQKKIAAKTSVNIEVSFTPAKAKEYQAAFTFIVQKNPNPFSLEIKGSGIVATSTLTNDGGDTKSEESDDNDTQCDCSNPPSLSCDNGMAIVLTGENSCDSDNKCVYGQTTIPCPNGCNEEKNECKESCENSDCNTPPADVCITENTLRKYQKQGSCDANTKMCSYTQEDILCDSGICENNECKIVDTNCQDANQITASANDNKSSGNPRIAYNGTQFGIVYKDYASTPDDILFVGMSSTGQLITSSPLPLFQHQKTPNSPGITNLGNKYVITWDEVNPANNASYGSVVYYAVVDNNQVVTAKPLVNNANQRSRYPSVSSDGTNIFVVWEADDIVNGQVQQNYKIYFAVYDLNGTEVITPKAISSEKAVSTSNNGPQIAYNGKNFGVIWDEKDSSSKKKVVFQAIDTNGNLIGSSITIIGGNVSENYHRIVGNTTDNEWAVTWYEIGTTVDEIYFARISNTGTLIGNVTKIVSSATDSRDPSLGFNGSKYRLVYRNYQTSSASMIEILDFDKTGTLLSQAPLAVSLPKDSNGGFGKGVEPVIVAAGIHFGIAWLDIPVQTIKEVFFSYLCQ